MSRILKVAAGLSLLLFQGCFAYLSAGDTGGGFKDIRWRKTFDEAAADAKKEDKPILLVGAAGELSGFC